MKIVVKCTCGKVLHVPVKYAGKRGRCPQCAKLLNVPTLSKQEPQEKITSCPTCGTYMSIDDEYCVSCYTNLKTGEWKLPYRKKVDWPKYGFIISNLLLLLYIVYLLNFRLPPNVEKQIKTPKRNSPTSSLKKIKDISKMSEKNLEEIEKKLQAIEKFIKEFSPVLTRALKKRKLLQKKYQNAYSKHQYQKLISLHGMDSNLGQWMMWENFNKEFPNTKAAEKAQKNLFNLQQNMLNFLQTQSVQIRHLLQEKRYQEIVTRITPVLLERSSILNYPKMPHKLQQTFLELINLYRKLPQPVTKKHNISKKEQALLLAYQKEFEQNLKPFHKKMFARDYQQAQILFENLWQKVNSLANISSTHTLLVALRNKLRDVQSVQRLFAIANDGAKKCTGLSHRFVFRDNKIVLGLIKKYNLKKFYLVTNNGNQKFIELSSLSVKDVLFFATKRQRDKNTYRYAGIFSCYEKKYNFAREAFLTAKELGESPQEIQKFIRWVNNIEKVHR